MKTAISIPDEVFREAERLARKLKKSRSALYREALAEYVARHGSEGVTEALNRLAGTISTGLEGFSKVASRRTLRGSEW